MILSQSISIPPYLPLLQMQQLQKGIHPSLLAPHSGFPCLCSMFFFSPSHLPCPWISLGPWGIFWHTQTGSDALARHIILMIVTSVAYLGLPQVATLRSTGCYPKGCPTSVASLWKHSEGWRTFPVLRRFLKTYGGPLNTTSSFQLKNWSDI